MTHAGSRTVAGIVAAIWFIGMALTLGSGYPLTPDVEPRVIGDTTARAIVDFGRIVLVGLGILSAALVDVPWLRERFSGRGTRP